RAVQIARFLRHVPADASAEKQAFRCLVRHPQRSPCQVLGIRPYWGQRSIEADQCRGRDCRRIRRRYDAIELGEATQRTPRGERRTATPTKRTRRSVESVWLAPRLEPGVPGYLGKPGHLLAEDEVEQAVNFPGADTGTLFTGRKLDDAPDRHRDWLL